MYVKLMLIVKSEMPRFIFIAPWPRCFFLSTWALYTCALDGHITNVGLHIFFFTN